MALLEVWFEARVEIPLPLGPNPNLKSGVRDWNVDWVGTSDLKKLSITVDSMEEVPDVAIAGGMLFRYTATVDASLRPARVVGKSIITVDDEGGIVLVAPTWPEVKAIYRRLLAGEKAEEIYTPLRPRSRPRTWMDSSRREELARRAAGESATDALGVVALSPQ